MKYFKISIPGAILVLIMFAAIWHFIPFLQSLQVGTVVSHEEMQKMNSKYLLEFNKW
jgi:hypothetical protein